MLDLQDQLDAMSPAQTSISGPANFLNPGFTLEIQPCRPPTHMSASLFGPISWTTRSIWSGNSYPERLNPRMFANRPVSVCFITANSLFSLQALVLNQPHFDLDIFTPNLLERVAYLSSDWRGFHSALVGAISLVACACLGSEMELIEQLILQKTRDACRYALSTVDRLDQYLLAQILEAQYLLRMGRIREAQLLASSKMPVQNLSMYLIEGLKLCYNSLSPANFTASQIH